MTASPKGEEAHLEIKSGEESKRPIRVNQSLMSLPSEGDFRFAEQLDETLRPNAPKNKNGSEWSPLSRL
jgi:hypothetical protein